MANESRSQAKLAANQARERKKQFLVAVLCLAFVVVLYVQFASDPNSTPMTSEIQPVAQFPSSETEASVVPTVAWTPTINREYNFVTLRSRTIEAIMQRHPLATPVFDEPEEVAEPTVTEPLIVRAIYATPQRSAAIVGEQIVRDGGQLPDGRTLVAASPNGLKTQAKGPNPSPKSSTD